VRGIVNISVPGDWHAVRVPAAPLTENLSAIGDDARETSFMATYRSGQPLWSAIAVGGSIAGRGDHVPAAFA